MFVKQFRSTWVRVPDPLHPGKRALEERLTPTGATSISHPSGQFQADDDGWFEVPADVASELLGRRHPGGERFYTPAEVNEEVRLGSAPAEKRKPGRPRKHADADGED